MTNRLKVIVSAYACSPYAGSEPGVGWGFVSALASNHELWVIVEEREFRDEIDIYLAEHPEFAQSVNFHFLRAKRNRVLRKLWPPSYYWYYKRWHKEAFQLARRLHREVGFDLAHQLSMVGFREPGYLWKLGIPFVWGPIGGMGLFPWRFLTKVGLYGGLYFLAYNLYNLVHMRFLHRPRLAALQAGNGLISMNKENQSGLYRHYNMSSEVCIPVGPPNISVNKIVRRASPGPFRIVWCGLHIHRKALNLALEALSALSADIEWELHVLGDGILKKKWESYAEKVGVASKCTFYGQVTREEVFKVMERSHVHLLTSLREGTPTVIIEASSFALPTVCLDCSGMSDMVDDTCGIKVPVTKPTEVVRGLTEAIKSLAQDEKLRLELAKGVVRRAQDFAWDKKVATVDRIYRRKLNEPGVTVR